ncbi:MAG: transposase [Patescibacteria group bacterium]|nr:transposase [Patescibacteria group bacterium]
MATKPRDIKANYFYHVYNRATDKKTIFYTEKDYEYFINKVVFFKEKTNIKILAYCILPNHFHFLLKEPETSDNPSGWNSQISRFISLLSNSYTKYFNLSRDHSGRIFQGPFKLKLVNDDNYLKILINYINLNHLNHKISRQAGDWHYSSHQNYLNQTKSKLIDKDYLIDFKEYAQGFKSYIDVLKNIDDEF